MFSWRRCIEAAWRRCLDTCAWQFFYWRGYLKAAWHKCLIKSSVNEIKAFILKVSAYYISIWDSSTTWWIASRLFALHQKMTRIQHQLRAFSILDCHYSVNVSIIPFGQLEHLALKRLFVLHICKETRFRILGKFWVSDTSCQGLWSKTERFVVVQDGSRNDYGWLEMTMVGNGHAKQVGWKHTGLTAAACGFEDPPKLQTNDLNNHIWSLFMGRYTSVIYVALHLLT